jgi:hypothetical protein
MAKHVHSERRVLSAPDEAAVDGWLEGSPGPDADGRRDRVGSLLSLLDVGLERSTQGRSDLVLVTMARVRRDRDRRAVARIEGHGVSPLAPADAEAVDRLVESSGLEDGSPAHRLLSSLEVSPSELAADRDRLVRSTLDLVQRDIDARRSTMRLSPAESRSFARPRMRLADIGAIAAVFMIGLGVLMPVLQGLRAERHKVAGQQDLLQAGLGFGLFANDHDDRLPARSAWTGKHGWWHVGDPDRSHSANLFQAVSKGYVGLQDLAAPGNPHAPTRLSQVGEADWTSPEQLSYSYQLFGERTPRLSGSRSPWTVVLTDRSPVAERAGRGKAIDVSANSSNHGGRGQNVLLSDGRVVFVDRPMLPNGDHLWLPRTLENRIRVSLGGRELPEGRDDAFVGP